ncbi:8157_t:CDS:1, partial [Paraglomus occultum]
MSIFRSIKPDQNHFPSPIIPPTLSISDFIDTLTPRENNLIFNPPYDLQTSLEDLLCSTRYQQLIRTKRKPPRPANAWILFRKNFANEYRIQNLGKCTMQKISKLAKDKWDIQSDAVKDYFATLAKLALLQHKATYP